MSTVKTNNVQIGQSVTATNNFTWYQPATPDGTVRLGNGNSGSVTDLVTLTSAGNLGIGTSSPFAKMALEQTGGDLLSARYNSGNPRIGLSIGGTSGAGFFQSNLVYSSGNVFNFDKTGLAWWVGQPSGQGYLAIGVNSGTAGTSAGTDTATYDALRISSSGNLGLGVTPSGTSKFETYTGAGAFNAITARFNATNSPICFGIANSNGFPYLGFNTVQVNGTDNQTYSINNFASRLDAASGGFRFFTAPSGTAGNAISFTQAMTLDASGNLLVGTTSSPTGSPVGKVLALSGVDIEGTAAINVTTSTTLLSRTSGVGGMFFVQGYNASGGAQGWWLLACIGATLTTIASNNATGLTVTFSSPGGGLRAVTASGTLIATCVAFTM